MKSVQCKTGFTGNGAYCGKDSDLDEFPDERLFCVDRLCYKVLLSLVHACSHYCPMLNYLQDNCPDTPNSGQENMDGDTRGDACDDDIDDDGWTNFQVHKKLLVGIVILNCVSNCCG